MQVMYFHEFTKKFTQCIDFACNIIKYNQCYYKLYTSVKIWSLIICVELNDDI